MGRASQSAPRIATILGTLLEAATTSKSLEARNFTGHPTASLEHALPNPARPGPIPATLSGAAYLLMRVEAFPRPEVERQR